MTVSHRIDSKITASQILFQIRGKGHLLRVSCILVLAVDPVSRNFITDMLPHYRYSSMLKPCIDCLPKHLFDLLRPGGCGDIPVPGDSAKERVPDTAADGKSLVAVCSKPGKNLLYLFRYYYLHILSSLLSNLHDSLQPPAQTGRKKTGAKHLHALSRSVSMFHPTFSLPDGAPERV